MDGFTDPDPAATDDDETVEPDFPAMMTEEDDDGEMMIVDASASCLKCDHFEVCAIFKGIQPMLQEWHTDDVEGAEKPIDLEKLAWHCRKYSPRDDDGYVDNVQDE